MSKRIVVLSDNATWETMGDVQVWTITDEAFDKLCDGDEPKHLTAGDVLDTMEVQ
jgi:hypothetical protein